MDLDKTEQDEAPVSVLAKIKARRDERVANEFLRLPIPTWGQDLVAQYEILPKQHWSRIFAVAKRDHEDGAVLDFIAQACTGILMRDPDTGAMLELADAHGPICYDDRLAKLLGFTPAEQSPVRSIVRYMFSDRRGHSNDIATGAHVTKIAQWMMDTSKEVSDAIVGEL